MRLCRCDDLQPKPLSEIGPAFMHDDNLLTSEPLKPLFPNGDLLLQTGHESVAVCFKKGLLSGTHHDECGEDRGSDRLGVVGIEPVMGIPECVDVRPSVNTQPWGCCLQ